MKTSLLSFSIDNNPTDEENKAKQINKIFPLSISSEKIIFY